MSETQQNALFPVRPDVAAHALVNAEQVPHDV